MKDPAFLFYSSDFLTGTMLMNFEDKGKYITILAAMHQQGRMSEENIRFLIGTVSDNLKSKFEIDDSGMWFNTRLEEEISKRVDFVESRRINGSKGGRPKKPLAKPNAKPKEEPKDILPEDDNENVIIIIDYLNKVSGKSFKSSSAKNKEKVLARINEGYKVDEFKKVVDKKVAEWLGTDMDLYLRPETLFGTKFDGYLNQQSDSTEDNDLISYNELCDLITKHGKHIQDDYEVAIKGEGRKPAMFRKIKK